MELYFHSLIPLHDMLFNKGWVLGKIFGCKPEKIIGGLGKLHNEWVYCLNSSFNVLVIK